MKKIVFYINTLQRGGAERVLANLANQFVNAGYAVFFITSYSLEDEYILDLKIQRFNLEEVERSSNLVFKNIKRISKLKRVLKEINPHLIISFLPETIFRILFINLNNNIPIVISVRNDPKIEYKRLSYKVLARILYLRADWIVFQTETAKNWFSKRIKNKSSVIFNQVDDAFFQVKRVKEEYYCAIGRLVEQKNYSMMIKAFAKFVTSYPDEKLYIYGEGGLKEDLYELIQTLGMDNNIFLKGITNGVPDILARAKAFLMTSDYEGVRNAVLEAMAVGVPVISTDCPCGGPKTVIEDGKSGILVPVGDELALLKALNLLQNDEHLRKNMSLEEKKYAINYNPEIVFCKWRSLIETISKKGRC